MTRGHLTEEEIQQLAELKAGATDGGHAAECDTCARRVAGARALERSLRQMPLEQASPALTATVMQSLGLVPRKRAAFWFVESLAAFAALCLVLGVLIAVFFLTGVVGGGEPVSVAAAEKSVSQLQSEVSGAASAALGWLTKSMQAISGSSGIEMTLLMVFVVAGLGILDRILLRPLRHPARR